MGPSARTLRPLRLAAAALVLASAALAAPAAAQMRTQVRARPVSLYPMARIDVLDSDATDVQSLVDAALHRAAQRSKDIAVGTPLVLRAACGTATRAAPACLGRLAGDGLVLRTTVQRSGSALLIAVQAVDGRGRTYGPLGAAIDAFVQSAEPITHVILALADQVAAADRRRAQDRAEAAAVAARAARPGAGAPLVPSATPDLRAAGVATSPVDAALSRPDAPRRSWKNASGPWVTGLGAALLAGGVALSVVNRLDSDDLDRKFASGGLTPADLAAYERVEDRNKLTAILLASGGTLTLAGVALWTAPPAKGALVAGVSGRF